MEPRPFARLASARAAEASPASRRWSATSTGSIARLPALHELDCDQAGFEWLVTDDADRSVFAWLRKGNATRARCLVVVNFTPNVYRDYRVRVPFAGNWREVLNTDSAHYGGSNVGNAGAVQHVGRPRARSSVLTIPPLAAIFLVPES